jgi:hypothetical protein
MGMLEAIRWRRRGSGRACVRRSGTFSCLSVRIRIRTGFGSGVALDAAGSCDRRRGRAAIAVPWNQPPRRLRNRRRPLRSGRAGGCIGGRGRAGRGDAAAFWPTARRWSCRNVRITGLSGASTTAPAIDNKHRLWRSKRHLDDDRNASSKRPGPQANFCRPEPIPGVR